MAGYFQLLSQHLQAILMSNKEAASVLQYISPCFGNEFAVSAGRAVTLLQ